MQQTTPYIWHVWGYVCMHLIYVTVGCVGGFVFFFKPAFHVKVVESNGGMK